MTRKAAAYFAQSYAEARRKFVDAATAAGIEPVAYAHPLIGHDGETLAMDVARFGPAEAPAVLIISSACHGAEGFCGSGVQNALLADAGFQAAAARGGVALLYVHALNPYGFSWWRRSTHENVDLNRNFQDFSKPLPHNAAYDRLAHLLVPAEWPPTPEVKAALAAYLVEHGAKGMQAAVSAGQYEHPQGLFYGGRNPTWSQQTLRHVLQDHGRRCSRMGWIDLHTGLGPSGHGERIFAGPDDAAALARARSWWGEAVTSMYDGSSESALLTGLMWLAAWQECPQAEVTGIALEYGTLPFDQVIDALRADQWLENHPEAPHGMRVQIKRQMRDAFYVDTEVWKSRVLEQGIEAAHQAVAGLTG
jgi:Protein of unknown function (DUF2817)